MRNDEPGGSPAFVELDGAAGNLPAVDDQPVGRLTCLGRPCIAGPDELKGAGDLAGLRRGIADEGRPFRDPGMTEHLSGAVQGVDGHRQRVIAADLSVRGAHIYSHVRPEAAADVLFGRRDNRLAKGKAGIGETEGQRKWKDWLGLGTENQAGEPAVGRRHETFGHTFGGELLDRLVYDPIDGRPHLILTEYLAGGGLGVGWGAGGTQSWTACRGHDRHGEYCNQSED